MRARVVTVTKAGRTTPRETGVTEIIRTSPSRHRSRLLIPSSVRSFDHRYAEGSVTTATYPSSVITHASRSWVPAYVATGIVWGCSFLFIKYSLGFLTPFGVAFMRCALGALTLVVIAVVRRIALPK